MDHGGDLTTALARYGFTLDDWLDLSTGINPFSYPDVDMPDNVLQHLPSRDDMHTLLIAARQAYNVPDGASIAAAPGSQAFIHNLPMLLAPKPTQIVTPTYSEHENAWRMAGHKIILSETPDPDASTFMILCNPNNPDCREWHPDELKYYASILAKKGGLLIIDEAFADTAPEQSSIPNAESPGLLILRSFGKFFGLAGLRLGFAIGEQPIIKRLQASFGPWPVSGAAIHIATNAFSNETWINDTRQKLKTEIQKLEDLLKAHSLTLVARTDLFVLAKTGNAAALQEHLARHAIWTRNFSYNNSWLRLGLPPNEQGFERLNRALSDAPLTNYSGNE